MKEDEDLRNYIAGMLDKMDTDVYEISVASDEIDFYEFACRAEVGSNISVAEDAVFTAPKCRTPEQVRMLSKVCPKHLVGMLSMQRAKKLSMDSGGHFCIMLVGEYAPAFPASYVNPVDAAGISFFEIDESIILSSTELPV